MLITGCSLAVMPFLKAWRSARISTPTWPRTWSSLSAMGWVYQRCQPQGYTKHNTKEERRAKMSMEKKHFWTLKSFLMLDLARWGNVFSLRPKTKDSGNYLNCCSSSCFFCHYCGLYSKGSLVLGSHHEAEFQTVAFHRGRIFDLSVPKCSL